MKNTCTLWVTISRGFEFPFNWIFNTESDTYIHQLRLCKGRLRGGVGYASPSSWNYIFRIKIFKPSMLLISISSRPPLDKNSVNVPGYVIILFLIERNVINKSVSEISPLRNWLFTKLKLTPLSWWCKLLIFWIMIFQTTHLIKQIS